MIVSSSKTEPTFRTGAPTQSSPTARPGLDIVVEGVTRHVTAAEAPITLGRDVDNRIRIDGPSVSGRHATLEASHDGWCYSDQSRFGSYLRGEAITTVDVTATMEVRLADPTSGPLVTLSPQHNTAGTYRHFEPSPEANTNRGGGAERHPRTLGIHRRGNIVGAGLATLFAAVGILLVVTQMGGGSSSTPAVNASDGISSDDTQGDAADATPELPQSPEPGEVDEPEKPELEVPTLPEDGATTDGDTTSETPTAPDAGTVDVDALNDDVDTAVLVVDGFWRDHWSEFFTGSYIAPTVTGFYDGTSADAPSCYGEPLDANNAFYCPEADYIAWDVDLMATGYIQGDSWVYLIIAHEWGHAIQARLDPALVWAGAELQADCLAGAALYGAAADGTLVFEEGDSKEIALGLTSLADETQWTDSTTHGDALERISAFDLGRSGGVNACLPA